MRKTLLFLIAIVGAMIAVSIAPGAITWAQQGKSLDVYFIDVEGGQATLFVSPSGQSMLVDTGFPGARDADRIADVAKQAGVKQIDFQLITHYHRDHVGGLPDLAKRLSFRTFVDHGPAVRDTPDVPKNYQDYAEIRDAGGHQHILAKPGLRLPIKGIKVEVVSEGTNLITKPLPGAGRANPLCADFQAKDEVQDPASRRRKRAIGRDGDLAGTFPDGRFRRPHLEPRTRFGVPQEPHRPGGFVPHHASRAGYFRAARARLCSAPARGRNEQRRHEGRRARYV